MTPAEARAATLTRFVTEWANRTPIDHDADNRGTPNAPYIRIVMRHEGGIRFTTSENQRFGLVFVQVFVQGGRGTAESDTLAYAAARILESRNIGIIRFSAAEIRDIGQDEEGSGLRQCNVTIPFEYEDAA